MSEGEVKLRAHWIEEYAAAEQFKHHSSAAFAIGGEPVTMALHRAIEEHRLRQRPVAEYLCRLAHLSKRLTKLLPQLTPHRVQPIINARLAKHVDGGQRRRRGDRVAARRRGGPRVVRPGQPLFVHRLHDFCLASKHADREAAAQPLAVGNKVGRHTVIFLRTTEGQAEAGDHFVEHQHDAQLGRDLAQSLQKTVHRRDAAVQRLDDHGGQIGGVVGENLLRRREVVVRRDQHIALDPRRAGAGRIGPRQLGRVAADEARHALRMLPVIRALEFQNLRPPGRRPRRPQTQHRRLGAAGDKAEALNARAEVGDALSELNHRPVHGGEVRAVRRRRAGCLKHFRVRVADERRAPRHGHVEILAAAGVPHATAPPALNHRRVALGDAVFTVRAAGEKPKRALAEIVGVVHFFKKSKAEPLGQVLGNVLDLGPGAARLDAVGHHRQAERATDGHSFRAGLDRLLCAQHGHPLFGLLLHPHATATGTTAKSFFAPPLHLADAVTQQVARRLVHAVDTRKVTRVVIGHRAVAFGRVEFAVVDQLLQKLGVMHDLELVAELRVVVRQRVHAVRTLGQDFPHAMLLQRRVVFLGQFLKQKLVAEPPGRVAGATFVRAKHGKVHTGLDQQLGDGPGDLLCAAIERPGATDPPQDFKVGMVTGQRHV